VSTLSISLSLSLSLSLSRRASIVALRTLSTVVVKERVTENGYDGGARN